MEPIADIVTVVIETPRGSLVKWRPDGGARFASPIPAPYNYGSVPGTVAPDGDPQDAIVLGPRLPRGHAGKWRVQGVVRFIDGGRSDDKWICGDEPPSRLEVWRIRLFFRLYARAKGIANRLRGRSPTVFTGYEPKT